MRIILISEPRTGSTSIFRYFHKTMPKFKVYLEPFNTIKKDPIPYDEILNPKNTFVKQLYKQIPGEYENLERNEFYEMVFNDFDKIVFLSRKDLDKQAESFSSALVSDKWEGQYMYDEKKHSEKLMVNMNLLKDLKKEMIEFAKSKKSKIFYYEDLFYDRENMVSFLKEIGCPYNDKLFDQYLDPSNKYRGDKKTKDLI